jgi:hypothetical protein
MSGSAATREESEMKTTTTLIEPVSAEMPRVVCELDASSRAEALLADALTLCEERDAALTVVWVLEPRVFRDPFPGSGGAVGTFGLPVVLHTAVERARRQGIAVTSAVRIGRREVVLRQVAEAEGAMALFSLGEDTGDLATKSNSRRPDTHRGEAIMLRL